MPDTVPIATPIHTALKALQDTIEQLRENYRDVYKPARDLIIATLELLDIKKSHSGDCEETDRFLESLIKEIDTIRVECEGLMIPEEGSLRRTLKLGKNLYHASAIKKKVGDLRKRVHDAQQDVLVKKVLAMALNGEDQKDTATDMVSKLQGIVSEEQAHDAQQDVLVKNGFNMALSEEDRKDTTTGILSELQGVVSELQVEIRSLVREAESKPKVARKIFGVDRMTEAERKAALLKTTLDLSVTTEEEKLNFLRLRIHTLRMALDTSAPTLYQESDIEAGKGYNPGPDDPFQFAYRDTSGSVARQDALAETISFLGTLQNPECMAHTPALALFSRSDELSWSLRWLDLRKEAMQLCTIAHQLIRKHSQSRKELDRKYLAKSLLTLSACRRDMGCLDDAVAASKEAVTIYKALVEIDPTDAMSLEFAKSLYFLFLALGAAEKWGEALAPIEDAVNVTRALAEKNRAAFNLPYANCLLSLSICLGYTGKREEALAPVQLAVGILTVLAVINPEAFKPVLANTLLNLCCCLGTAGKLAEALAPIQEAVEIRRALAKGNPGMFNAALASALGFLSGYFRDRGKMDKALPPLREAVEIRRALAEKDPEAFNPGLAKFLINMSKCLSQVGKSDEALAPIQEAVRINRSLVDSDSKAFDPALVVSLIDLSSCLRDVGKSGEALSAIQEAEKISYRALAEANSADFSTVHVTILYKLSECLGVVGRKADAIVPMQEAVEIHRALAGKEPKAFTPALARSLYNLSRCLSDAGKIIDAIGPIKEAVEIRRALVRSDPGALGKKDEALAAYQEALRMYRAFSESTDADAQDSAQSLYDISRHFSEIGNRDEALAAIRKSVRLYKGLYWRAPDHFYDCVAKALEALRDCLEAVGKTSEAFSVGEEAEWTRLRLQYDS